jgi:hypothetical protein
MGRKIYDKSIKELFRVFADKQKEKETFSVQDAIIWFHDYYPKIKSASVRAHLIRLTVNNPTRVHYGAGNDDDLFFRENSGAIRKFIPEKDPLPIYKHKQHQTDKEHRKQQRHPKMNVDERVGDLIKNFETYLNYFNTNIKFSGPSIYFHIKVIEKIRNTQPYEALFNDNIFFDYIYAVLASWGMHRMGDKTAKMSDFEDFRQSILDNKEELIKLSSYKLQQLTGAEYRETKRGLSKSFDALQVMDSDAKLVGNSKALHHLLPDLVVPIDRTHTLRFFFNNTNITYDEKSLFLELFDRFREIAKDVDLSKVPLDGFNTSVPKIIDNAIMGYAMQKLLKSRKKKSSKNK